MREDGRWSHEAQSGSADLSQTRKNSLQARDAHSTSADLERLHALMGHYARMLWDIQATRIGLTNRVSAMERDELPEEFFGPAQIIGVTLTKAEAGLNRYLEVLAKQHPMAGWIADAPGIGLPGFARLLAVTGPLDRFPTVSKLWKYLGLAVMDGHRQRMPKGEVASHTNCAGGTHLHSCKPDCKTDHHPNCSPDGIGTAYAPRGLVVCHQLGESIVKVGRGKYREAYDRKKAEYEARPEWADKTQAHRHAAAMRYAVKELVKDMWVEWHRKRSEAQSLTVPLDPQNTAA